MPLHFNWLHLLFFSLSVYLLVNVHRLQVVDVAGLNPLGCLQHWPLQVSKATVSDGTGWFTMCLNECYYYLLAGLHWLDHLSRNTWGRRAGVWQAVVGVNRALYGWKTGFIRYLNRIEGKAQTLLPQSEVLTTHCFQIVITTIVEHILTKFSEETDSREVKKCLSVPLCFHPYILHAAGQPWTANLPRWREKSVHLVNMQIRWEREMRDTRGGWWREGENRGWRAGRGEGKIYFFVPFK